MLIAGISYAQFSEAYAPANWTLTNVTTEGSVNTFAPDSIEVIGGDDQFNTSGGHVEYTITSIATGPFSFDWAYTTLDGPLYDPFGVVINGLFTEITDSSGPSDQTGTYSGSASLGDVFGFRINTTDNQSGAPTVTITNFSPPGGVVPIQLSLFTATLIGAHSVKVEWSTATETNNYGFYVERRTETDATWTTVSDLIPGAGTILEEQQYSWTDESVQDDVYRYRLRQVDLDGSNSNSAEIRVVVTGVMVVDEIAPREFSVKQNYPNPFNPSTTIKFSVEKDEHAMVKVYNLMGQEMATLFDGQAEPGRYYKITFNASRLSSGIYLYRVITDSRTEIKRMALIK